MHEPVRPLLELIASYKHPHFAHLNLYIVNRKQNVSALQYVCFSVSHIFILLFYITLYILFAHTTHLYFHLTR